MQATQLDRESAQQTIRELKQRTPAEIDEAFENGGVPTFEEVRGPTLGGWLASQQQPWWARLFIKITLDNPAARWTGKGFVKPFAMKETGSGINLFNNNVLPLRYQFRTMYRTAEHDGEQCLALRYPFGSVMWGLIDDVRRVDAGVFVGQMVYRFPWQRRRRFIGYFVLCALVS